MKMFYNQNMWKIVYKNRHAVICTMNDITYYLADYNEMDGSAKWSSRKNDALLYEDKDAEDVHQYMISTRKNFLNIGTAELNSNPWEM